MLCVHLPVYTRSFVHSQKASTGRCIAPFLLLVGAYTCIYSPLLWSDLSVPTQSPETSTTGLNRLCNCSTSGHPLQANYPLHLHEGAISFTLNALRQVSITSAQRFPSFGCCLSADIYTFVILIQDVEGSHFPLI